MLATAENIKIEKNGFERLCCDLPFGIRQELKKKVLTKEKPSKKLREYFFENSHFCKILGENPGTPQMLNEIYAEENYSNNAIDFYLANNSWPSQALRFRLDAVIRNGVKIILQYIQQGNPSLFIANLGSGAAQDLSGIFSAPVFEKFPIIVDLVDLKYEHALKLAKETIPNKPNLKLVLDQKNYMKLDFKGNIDIGFFIGTICSNTYNQRINILKTIRPYFKNGGILIISCTTPKMFLENPEAMYILSRIVPWRLNPIPAEALEILLKENGFKPFYTFFDEPTRYHTMVACRVE